MGKPQDWPQDQKAAYKADHPRNVTIAKKGH